MTNWSKNKKDEIGMAIYLGLLVGLVCAWFFNVGAIWQRTQPNMITCSQMGGIEESWVSENAIGTYCRVTLTVNHYNQ